MAAFPPVEAAPGGVRVFLRVSPKASRDAVMGVMEGPGGRLTLKVAVTAVPEDGKANAAVIALLAKLWRVPKGSVAVAAGGADRSKILFISGDTDALLTAIGDWAAALPRLN